MPKEKNIKKLFIAEYSSDKEGFCSFSFIADNDIDDKYKGEIEWNRKERVKNFQQAFKKEKGFDIREEDIGYIWILDFSRDYKEKKEYKIYVNP